MRTIVAAAVVSAGLCFAAGVANAKLGEGEKAPDFEAKELINLTSKKCDLKSLRGQVVLYEIFRTW